MNKTTCNMIQLRHHASIVGNGTAESCLARNLCCTSKEQKKFLQHIVCREAKSNQLSVCWLLSSV